MDMVNRLPVQILRPQSFRDHGVGDLEDLSKRFYHILVKCVRLTLPTETDPFGGVGGRLELNELVNGDARQVAGNESIHF
jgi:hypothetical protein